MAKKKELEILKEKFKRLERKVRKKKEKGFFEKKTVFRAEKLLETKPLPKGVIARLKKLQRKVPRSYLEAEDSFFY